MSCYIHWVTCSAINHLCKDFSVEPFVFVRLLVVGHNGAPNNP